MAKVDIVVSSRDVKDSDFSKAGNGGQSTDYPMEALNEGSSGSNLVLSSVFAQQLANTGKSAIKNAFNYYKSNYGNLTGDYIGQSKIDNAFSVASTVVTIGSSIVQGAKLGATGGVYGAVIGAGVGAVVSVGSIVSSNASGVKSYDLSIAKTNAESSFNSARFGILLSGNRG